MHDGDTYPQERLRDDPYKILRVTPGASADAVKAAYRKRARELHPDVSGDEATASDFRQLVLAFKTISQIQPGDLETHPLWHKLSGLDQYWARELGYATAEELEDWLQDTTKIEEYRDEPGDCNEPGELDGAVADDVSQPPQAAGAPSEEEVDSVSEAGIGQVLAYRQYLGNEQWRVRWAADVSEHGLKAGNNDGVPEESWERYAVLDTEALRCEALRLRAQWEKGVGPRT